ncbi:MAG: VWA domain-containing protein [Candidatus Moranbacteria bacterium]|nr:VWA domain-containing protein [Candidatus Moranbacteria bacterium]
MKKITYFFVAIISLFIIGCQPMVSEEKAKQIMDEIITIPIDYDGVVGEASTTRNFYFVFDQSGSMSESCSGQSRMNAAQKAINEFAKTIPNDVRIGLLVLGRSGAPNQIAELLPLNMATDQYKSEFLKHINSLRPDSGTPLVTAIKIAVDKMVDQKKSQLGYGDYRIIVITDGHAGDGDVKDAAVYAMQYGIAIYTVGLCINFNHPLYHFSVSYTEAKDYKQLSSALQQMTAESESFDGENYDASVYE